MADLTQEVQLTSGSTYKLVYEVTTDSDFTVSIGSDFVSEITNPDVGPLLFEDTVSITSESGTFLLSFSPVITGGDQFMLVTNVSLKKIITAEVAEDRPVSEFLVGTTDYGREIFFRADTKVLELSPTFETFASPLSVVTRLQRGTMTKCFIALEDEDFYELQGTVTKGVSIMKVHSRSKTKAPSPPIARKLRISWRDSSKQLCRLIQTALISIPGTMEMPE